MLILKQLRILIFIQRLVVIIDIVFAVSTGISLPVGGAIAHEMVGHMDLWPFVVVIAVCSLCSLGRRGMGVISTVAGRVGGAFDHEKH